ncbi:MAG: hypothetical protein SFX18_00085 [Pirellulales bacterium]|nr:hypothetical protein [Pirellulales bacterium]
MYTWISLLLSFCCSEAPLSPPANPLQIEVFHVYWLTPVENNVGYGACILTPVRWIPLGEDSPTTRLRGEILQRQQLSTEERQKLATVPPRGEPKSFSETIGGARIDVPVVKISTYGRDSIWNAPPSPAIGMVTPSEIHAQNGKYEVVIDGVRYQVAAGTPAEALKLLENPEGKAILHRLRGPLDGFEREAIALKHRLRMQLELEAVVEERVKHYQATRVPETPAGK